ncbi:MAG: DUF3276 family protein [Mangrovibacterium sp.]
MEGFESKDELKDDLDGKYKREVYTKAVRAGKRTYFFDVKSTRKDEYYLTITESKKHYDDTGQFHFEKHKIFLYQEDFEKFTDGLNEVMEFIGSAQGFSDDEEMENEGEVDVVKGNDRNADFEPETDDDELFVKDYSKIEFEDLRN